VIGTGPASGSWFAVSVSGTAADAKWVIRHRAKAGALHATVRGDLECIVMRISLSLVVRAGARMRAAGAWIEWTL
jgi:hypothetical protein